tara:strand:+ start:560 stop:901 length:342 start_codon:yes stop_codon:yes gene_type:complete
MTKLTFNDIKFGVHPIGMGIHGELKINDYTLSVIAGPGFYSNFNSGVFDPQIHNVDDFSSFEIAVFNDDGYVTRKFFDDDHDNDVRGWLTRDEINDLINRLYTADLINLVSNN